MTVWLFEAIIVTSSNIVDCLSREQQGSIKACILKGLKHVPAI